MKPFNLIRKAPKVLPRTPISSPSSLTSIPSRFIKNLTPPRTIKRLPHHLPRTPKRPYSTPPPKQTQQRYNPTPHLTSPPSLSLSQRLRKLSREYGWSAFGVYLLLTALDFPFCFAAVRYLGANRVGRWEHVIVEWIKGWMPESVKEAWREGRRRIKGKPEEGERGVVMVGEEGRVEGYGVVNGEGVGVVGYDHGVKEADEMNQREDASIWTQLALAYAIHKSFIFIRVPLTVAVTPKVVKVLRGWGWDIGKRRPKGAS